MKTFAIRFARHLRDVTLWYWIGHVLIMVSPKTSIEVCAFHLDTIAGCNEAMVSGTLVLHSYQDFMASLGTMQHELPTMFGQRLSITLSSNVSTF